MSQSKKKEGHIVERLFEYAVDYEQTTEEARQELELDGVSVDAAMSRILAGVQRKRKEWRLEWQGHAREKAKEFNKRSVRQSYDNIPRPELLALLRARPEVRIGFRNFEELTDEDLRTLLADQDELSEENSRE